MPQISLYLAGALKIVGCGKTVPGVSVDHGNRSLGYELAGEGVSVWAYQASVCVCVVAL